MRSRFLSTSPFCGIRHRPLTPGSAAERARGSGLGEGKGAREDSALCRGRADQRPRCAAGRRGTNVGSARADHRRDRDGVRVARRSGGARRAAKSGRNPRTGRAAFGEPGDFASLLTNPTTWVSEKLATYYGISGSHRRCVRSCRAQLKKRFASSLLTRPCTRTKRSSQCVARSDLFDRQSRVEARDASNVARQHYRPLSSGGEHDRSVHDVGRPGSGA